MKFQRKVPQNLDETVDALTVMFNKSDEWDLLKDDENTFVAKIHHVGGRWIRNNWSLWEEKGELYNQLKSLGFTHADDMSTVILKNFYRTKNGLNPLDIEKEARYYREYWEKANAGLGFAQKISI